MSNDLLDLSPDRAAPLLVGAVRRQHAARLREAAEAVLARQSPDARALGEHLLDALATLAAQLDALDQVQRQAALSRAERLRIDPLRAIPPERVAMAVGAPPEAETGPVAVEAGDLDFRGFGWFAPERTDRGTLRWSGEARCATLLLPALGGGDLLLTLSLRAPFGIPLDITAYDLFLDGMPLTFATVANDGVTGLFEARVTLAPAVAGARVTLLLHGPQHEDPASGPRRDTRRLGLGLAWARLERA